MQHDLLPTLPALAASALSTVPGRRAIAVYHRGGLQSQHGMTSLTYASQTLQLGLADIWVIVMDVWSSLELLTDVLPAVWPSRLVKAELVSTRFSLQLGGYHPPTWPYRHSDRERRAEM